MFHKLYFKLSAALVLLFLLIGVALVLLTRFSVDRYYQEVTQRLNAPIAMYVAGEAPLIEHGEVNKTALQTLAHQAMVINPTVEVYLLSPEGDVLSHDLGADAKLQTRVDMAPVKRFLDGTADLPLQGDDPRETGGQKIFTAAAVESDGGLEGYVYVVLGGQKYEQFAASAGVSEALRLSTLAVVGCVIFGLGSALLIFARLSGRLKSLTSEVNTYCSAAIGEHTLERSGVGDEVAQLSCAFDAMQARIEDQLGQLRQADQQRRELVANVSHDLRTPLATLQGYIETLALKHDDLTPDQQKAYLKVAHHHGVRLGRLIDDLFELARLDSGAVEPHWDTFCLAELLADIVQEFRFRAERKGLTLTLDRRVADATVRGDIRLIERAITNLLDNAIRHTPAGGHITLLLNEHPNGVQLTLADTGVGIAQQDLPRIFDRGFRTGVGPERGGESTGLGLAIVKRILELHDAQVAVSSELDAGTRFTFSLVRGSGGEGFPVPVQ